jgi:Fe-S cluster assembly protein SufD
MPGTIAMIPTKAETMLAEQFALALPGLPGAAPALKQRRSDAFDLIRRQGLPSRRNEAWHYTDLRARMGEAALPMLSIVPSSQLGGQDPADPFAGAASRHFSFPGGLRILGGYVPAGLEFVALRDALLRNHPLLPLFGSIADEKSSPVIALNTAFATDGLIVRAKRGVKIPEPIRIFAPFSMDTARAAASRVVVVLEEGAELTLILSQVGPDGVPYQSNAVCEFDVGDNASLDIVSLNQAGDEAQVLVNTSVRLGAGARFNAFNLGLGGALSRQEMHVVSRGADARIGLNGVMLLRHEQHYDNTLIVDHQAPGCESRELFRSVIDGQATGVFQGKIMVKREAQQTDGRMASNAILLSDDATMNNKPELEIFADNVQCAHGATCGALDESLLFYLQSRGLPKKEAEALMIQAFCGEAIETVADEKVREALNRFVAEWLARRT